MNFAIRFAVIVSFAVACGCNRGVPTTTKPAPSAAAGPAWFEDVTAARGVNFVHDAGPTGGFALPQVMGSGLALFDFDGDGRLDIYLIQNAGPKSEARNRLYQQQADGSFRDVSSGSGLDVAGYGMGAAVGDIDNDGLPDLCLTEFGRTRLFRNLGGGKFQDISTVAGIDNPQWGTSAAFFDYDRDGWLDLVVVNYVEFDPSVKCGSQGGAPDYCNPSMFKGTVDRLWRNLGPQAGSVRFEDVTLRSGLATGTGNGLGVLCADFTGDGRPDIFVANDGQANRLWVQQKDGKFRDEAHQRGVAVTGMGTTAANMGVAIGDVDGDGLFDLFVTHLGDEFHTLWRQNPRGYFQDRTVGAGLAATDWRGTGFGTAFADFNCDSFLDLVLVNGRVARRRDDRRGPSPGQFWSMYHDRNQLLTGSSGGKLQDQSAANAAVCGTPAVYRGLALGDLDSDGALDMVVTETAGPAHIYRNIAPRSGHWLGLRCVDEKLKRDVIGAEIYIHAGKRVFWGMVNPNYSYLSSCDPRVHFGLGVIDKIDQVMVRWPDGLEESFSDVGIDRYSVLKRGTGRPVEGAKK
jgi:hypothetical protein